MANIGETFLYQLFNSTFLVVAPNINFCSCKYLNSFFFSGIEFKMKTIELQGKKIKLQIWFVYLFCSLLLKLCLQFLTLL